MENITQFLTPQILALIFFVVLIVVAIMTIALMYHWRFYSQIIRKRIISAEWWFTGVTVLLLFLMLFALFGYTASQ